MEPTSWSPQRGAGGPRLEFSCSTHRRAVGCAIGAAGGRTALDAAGLSLADGSAAEHQRGIWERVCGKMVDMMDPGCGHNTPPFEETRAAMYAMMQKKAPATRAQRALAIMERNRQKRMEQLLVLKAKAVIRGEMHPDDVADPQERALIIAALKVHLRDLKEQARAAPVSFGAVVDATARTYIDQVALAGVGVWVVVHLYSAAREDCRFVDAVFTSLAPRRPAVKFVRVEYREALPEMDTVTLFLTSLLCLTHTCTHMHTHMHTHTSTRTCSPGHRRTNLAHSTIQVVCCLAHSTRAADLQAAADTQAHNQ